VIDDGNANIYLLKQNGKSLTSAPLPPTHTHKIKLGKGSKSTLCMRKTRVKCTTSESKPQIALLIVKPNINECAKPLSLFAHQDLKDEVPEEPITRVPLPIILISEESTHKDD